MFKKKDETDIVLVFNLDGKNVKLNVSAMELDRLVASQKGDIVKFNLYVNGSIKNVLIAKDTLEQALFESYKISIVPKKYKGYLTDLTSQIAARKVPKLLGREHETEKIWSCIGRPSRCNAVLVGDDGVGKNKTVIEITRQLARREAPNDFLSYRVIKLKVKEFLKIDKDKEFKKVLQDVADFIDDNASRIILYLDNLLYFKYDERLAFYLYALFKSNVKVIGCVRTDHFEEYFVDDFEIAKYLNSIDIKEPELSDVYTMVKSEINSLAKRYNISISPQIIKFVIYTSELSNFNSGIPGSTISVFKWAFSNAYRKGKTEVEKEDVLECYNANLRLFEKAETEEKLRIAYHEIGHYLIHMLCENIKNEKIAFVSILPMMDFLGVNWTYRVNGKQLNYSRKAYMDLIKIYLAGRAAEELYSGEYADGASSDLEVANSLAEALITTYGLSDKEKQVNRSYTASGYYLKEYLFSDNLREEINGEIKAIIDSAYAEVKKVLEDNKNLVELLATSLLQYEILTGEELEVICMKYNQSKTVKTKVEKKKPSITVSKKNIQNKVPVKSKVKTSKKN